MHVVVSPSPDKIIIVGGDEECTVVCDVIIKLQ